MNKIKKFLLKFYSENELAFALASKMGDLDDEEMTDKAVKLIFKDLAKVDGLPEYFRDTARKDVLRFFAATNDKERDVVKGAYARTAFLRSQVLKSRNIDSEE